MRFPLSLVLLVLVLSFGMLTACQGQPGSDPGTRPVDMAGTTRTPNPPATLTAVPSRTPTPTPYLLAGAGDISICGQKGDDQTADLLEDLPAAIFTLGDNSNENGTEFEYLNCFDPSWGRFLDRLYPVPGNHDYATDNGKAYYEYFRDGPAYHQPMG